MRRYESAGIAVAPVLLPRKGIDLTKWAVVACDQFTSQPEYWREVEEMVGDEPSTLRLIYPEVYLEKDDPVARIKAIHKAMDQYLAEGVFESHDGMVYVERQTGDRIRKGLVLCVDLEEYNYTKGSTSLIRATEGTILERIPPRVKIRQGAPLESPHIMVLIDDPDDTVIGPLAARKGELTQVYDVELMKGSGHLTGYLMGERELEEATAAALAALAEPERYCQKYGLDQGTAVLLYAMGDGNHSLATAKASWEGMKEQAGGFEPVSNSLARYALVELVNVHDPALEFEPIHRVLFSVRSLKNIEDEMRDAWGERVAFVPVATFQLMKDMVDDLTPGVHKVGLIRPGIFQVILISEPEHNLPVGSLQPFLDQFLARGGAEKIDYVHGTEALAKLGVQPRNLGFYLPVMNKDDLFKTVILDGALPRKTFSMGEAEEKRFYFECRCLDA
jgi:hypothetical protein